VGVGDGFPTGVGLGVGEGLGDFAPTPPQPMALKKRAKIEKGKKLRRLAFTNDVPFAQVLSANSQFLDQGSVAAG
jgi:hypothetical protein